MNDLRQAYVDGWNACFAGEDGRYTNPHAHKEARDLHSAWTHGFLDAMEAEDEEQPEPEVWGY